MENEFEVCIMCGAQTDIPVSRNINERYGYIEGAGQLCEDCWKNQNPSLFSYDD